MKPDLIHDRITELESRLEFTDDTIARLNDALVVQQQRYFEMERRLTCWSNVCKVATLKWETLPRSHLHHIIEW